MKNFLRKAMITGAAVGPALASFADTTYTANSDVTQVATDMAGQLGADLAAILPIIGGAAVLFLGPWLIKKLLGWIKSR